MEDINIETVMSFQDALKNIDKAKVDMIRKSLPPGNRYASEQMTASEIRQSVTKVSDHLSTDVSITR